jgi:hypothetical protein
MNDGLKVALAVIAGDYFGRHHKMRLALIILAGQLPGQGTLGSLLEQRTKVLGGATPDVGKITERVRGDLLDIGKAAATRAASRSTLSATSSTSAPRHCDGPRPAARPRRRRRRKDGAGRPARRAPSRSPNPKRPTRRRPNPSPSLRRGRCPGFVSPGP